MKKGLFTKYNMYRFQEICDRYEPKKPSELLLSSEVMRVNVNYVKRCVATLLCGLKKRPR